MVHLPWHGGTNGPLCAGCDCVACWDEANKLWRGCNGEYANCARNKLTADPSAEQRVGEKYSGGEERSAA